MDDSSLSVVQRCHKRHTPDDFSGAAYRTVDAARVSALATVSTARAPARMNRPDHHASFPIPERNQHMGSATMALPQ